MDATKDADFRAFKLDVVVTEGAQLSFSGYFPVGTELKVMDDAVDQLMAVADRQRAKFEKRQFEMRLAAEEKVLEQEKERALGVHAIVDKKNGAATDYDKNAVSSVDQNIQRLQVSIAAGHAAIEGLKPRLRE